MRTRRKRRLAQGDDAVIIAQTFVFSNGVVAQGWDGGSCCGLRPSSAGGWLGLRRCPTGPPSNVIGNRGTPPVPPAGAAPPAPCLGNGGVGVCLPGRRVRGEGQDAPVGRVVLLWLAPSFSGGVGLACVVVPPAHPPMFLETGGLPLYPRRGLRPLHPAWGTRGVSFSCLGASGPPS